MLTRLTLAIFLASGCAYVPETPTPFDHLVACFDYCDAAQDACPTWAEGPACQDACLGVQMRVAVSGCFTASQRWYQCQLVEVMDCTVSPPIAWACGWELEQYLECREARV